jgi:RNA polymerase-binding transcription factor DksA
MSYCRYCGTEINYSRTTNDKWLPYDVSGNPHFCQEEKKNQNSGLAVCEKCGKPIFKMKGKLIDYSTLNLHVCKKGDITRYQKFIEKQKKDSTIKKTSNKK